MKPRAKPRLVPPGKQQYLTIQLTPQTLQIIEVLVGYGIYGHDAANVCTRLIDQGLERHVKRFVVAIDGVD